MCFQLVSHLNELISSGNATKVPIEAKMLVVMKIRRVWMIRLENHPLNFKMSSVTFSKSFTLGFRMVTSRMPATIPTPIVGFNAVIGAASMDTMMVTGCARESRAAIPVREALSPNQYRNIERP